MKPLYGEDHDLIRQCQDQQLSEIAGALGAQQQRRKQEYVA
jgi:hypothetical protein